MFGDKLVNIKIPTYLQIYETGMESSRVTQLHMRLFSIMLDSYRLDRDVNYPFLGTPVKHHLKNIKNRLDSLTS